MACVVDSINEYLQRAGNETNPIIARLLREDGSVQDHWFYISDQVVVTTGHYDLRDKRVIVPKFYCAQRSQLPDEIASHFQEGRFIKDISKTCSAESFKSHGRINITFDDLLPIVV
jgi:hypothetical protein